MAFKEDLIPPKAWVIAWSEDGRFGSSAIVAQVTEVFTSSKGTTEYLLSNGFRTIRECLIELVTK